MKTHQGAYNRPASCGTRGGKGTGEDRRMGRVFGRGWPEAYELPERLVGEFDAAFALAKETAASVMARSVPALKRGGSVELRWREATPALEAFLEGIEEELGGLCVPHDHRRLLLVSRLCVGLPAFAEAGESPHRTRARSLAADLWAQRCGDRSGLRRDHTPEKDPVGALGDLSDGIGRDAIVLHLLSSGVWRGTAIGLRQLAFSRLFSGEHSEHGPTVEFRADGSATVKPGASRADLFSFLYMARYDLNRPLSGWGVADAQAPEPQGPPLALHYLHAGLAGGSSEGFPFVARSTWAREFVGHLTRFGSLFEERAGLPASHALAILRGLCDLGVERGLVDGGRLERWGRATAAMLVSREDLLGGPLEERARGRLPRYTRPGEEPGDLGASVERFVKLARSDGPRPQDEHRRGLWAPYLLHGEHHEETWVVDFLSVLPFTQRLVDLMEISERSQSTGAPQHDAYVRTSAFDRGLADFLGGTASPAGWEPAFPDLRADPGLPNVTVPLSKSGAERELDLVLRRGNVLVAVETWAREADKAIEDGDYGALRRRWRSVKDKLRETDRRYARDLIEDTRSAEILRGEGVRYVLPLLCGPRAEPVASADPKYWLRPRPPVGGTQQEVRGSIPRVLTPTELERFLNTTSESEVAGICEESRWVVRETAS